MNDTVNAAVENATYCKPNDPKRPGKVGLPAYGINPTICPLDGSPVPELTDAWPDAWYVRVMFDELLDPEIETLEPVLDAMGQPTDMFNGSLARTQPVTLQCQDVAGNLVDVDYDGYYSPSGNRVTWPLGPSLVIQPLDPTIVPVESRCQVTLKESIKDKDGHPVPLADRGPFPFKLAPVTVIGVGPADGDVVDPTVGGVELDFNVEIDGSQVFCASPTQAACAGDPTRVFSLEPAADATNANVDNVGTALVIGADLLGGKTYTFKAPSGLKIKDKCGHLSTVAGLPEDFSFETNKIKFVSINPGGGNAVAPSKKITLSFNQVVDTVSFVEGVDFEISPKPANFSISPPPGNPTPSIRLLGDYDLNKKYTLTIKPGASIADFYTRQTIDFPAGQVTEFTTVSAIAITAQSPANGARVVKAPTASGTVRLTFNQELIPNTLGLDKFTLTTASGMPVSVAPNPLSGTASANVSISYPMLPAGSYKFTLKAGATLNDRIAPTPNVYTQAADRVITFTIADAPPSGPAFKCLGAP
jgi:hypothetical protein